MKNMLDRVVFVLMTLCLSLASYQYQALAACSQNSCKEINAFGSQVSGANSCKQYCTDNPCTVTTSSCLQCCHTSSCAACVNPDTTKVCCIDVGIFNHQCADGSCTLSCNDVPVADLQQASCTALKANTGSATNRYLCQTPVEGPGCPP